MSKKMSSDTLSKEYHMTKLCGLLVRQLCGCKTKQIQKYLEEFSHINASDLCYNYSLVYVVAYKPTNPKPRELRTYGDYGLYSWRITGLIVDDEEVNFKINFGPIPDVIKVDEHQKEVSEWLEIHQSPDTTKSAILSANFLIFVCSKVGKPIPSIGQSDDHGNRVFIRPLLVLEDILSTHGSISEDSKLTDFGTTIFSSRNVISEEYIYSYEPIHKHIYKISALSQVRTVDRWSDVSEFTSDKVLMWFRETQIHREDGSEILPMYKIINFKEVSQNDDTRCKQTCRCS